MRVGSSAWTGCWTTGFCSAAQIAAPRAAQAPTRVQNFIWINYNADQAGPWQLRVNLKASAPPATPPTPAPAGTPPQPPPAYWAAETGSGEHAGSSAPTRVRPPPHTACRPPPDA